MLKHQTAFSERVDVLQVTRSVDCVAHQNVRNVYNLLGHPFLHVIVTPDTTRCHDLRRLWDHVRCRSDEDVLENVDVHVVQRLLYAIGPKIRNKGAMWFFQQMLKLGAVAHGIDGLSEHVRVMDGETLLLKSFDWFTPNGDEIFDICDTWSCAKVGDGLNHEVGDGLNHERYGALYYRLTGQSLVGSPALVSHGMSMTRTNVQNMLTAFSPNGTTWRSNAWVSNSLKQLCDHAALTGFSEYYYYASWVLFERLNGKGSALVRMSSDTCKRVEMRSHQCDATLRRALVQYDSHYAYVILENHESRTRNSSKPEAYKELLRRREEYKTTPLYVARSDDDDATREWRTGVRSLLGV